MPSDYLILLHGLSRNKKSMAKMANYFSDQGYQVKNLDYPSKRYTLDILVDLVEQQIAAECTELDRPLSMVGHSMGSIIAHLYIKKYQPPNLNKVVALGPPFQGSTIIDHLGKHWWYKKFHGPAALQLATTENGICHQLGNIAYPLGVIAGTKAFFLDWFFSKYWLEHPNDGKVTVSSTQITGCQDFITLPLTHSFLPSYPVVIEQTEYFLKHGYFKKD